MVAPQVVPGGLEQLPNVDAARLRDALEFHKAIREPVIQRMNSGVATPYENHLFVQPAGKRPPSQLPGSTAHCKCPTTRHRKHRKARAPCFYRGDGTVPGPAAIPIEWRTAEKALALDEKHVAMPSSQRLTDIVQNLVNPLDAHEYMGGGRSRW